MERLDEFIIPVLDAAREWGLHYSEFEVCSWPQSWPDTTCGFGGVGGQAFTPGQCVVCINGQEARVYHNSKLARIVKRPSKKFWDAISSQLMPGKVGSWAGYERDE